MVVPAADAPGMSANAGAAHNHGVFEGEVVHAAHEFGRCVGNEEEYRQNDQRNGNDSDVFGQVAL